jgi:hypothetical protein
VVIARFELLDEDGGPVEPYGYAVTSLDDAVQALVTVLVARMAVEGSLRVRRDDLTAWRWIIEFTPACPDAPGVLMALLDTLARVKGTQMGLPEVVIQIWREFALRAILAEAVLLEIDAPGAEPEVKQMSLPQTFTERASLAGWEIIPIVETVDCMIVNDRVLQGTTLEDLTDYATLALEITFANEGADVTNPETVAVSATRYTLAIMLDGEVMLHKTYRTDFFITTTTTRPAHKAKRR